jgi:hypothetical protein
MRRLLSRSLIVLFAITTVSCAHNLPPSFPKPPVIDLCVRQTNYWECQRTDSGVKRREPIEYVDVGVTIDDYNRGQNYRRTVESWIVEHCQ